jgi:hypothetical protein
VALLIDIVLKECLFMKLTRDEWRNEQIGQIPFANLIAVKALYSERNPELEESMQHLKDAHRRVQELYFEIEDFLAISYIDISWKISSACSMHSTLKRLGEMLTAAAGLFYFFDEVKKSSPNNYILSLKIKLSDIYSKVHRLILIYKKIAIAEIISYKRWLKRYADKQTYELFADMELDKIYLI